VWDNPSKTTIEPGFNEQTRWTSEVGDRVSFFVIAGATRTRSTPATGCSPAPRPAAQGRLRLHPVQAALRQPEGGAGRAQGYRDRHLPADVLVVDWFYYTKMGQFDLDPSSGPIRRP
jgi:alpha-D-xyloside xylohydrolase